MAGISSTPYLIHLTDVWDADGAYGLTVRSHRWALQGMPISLRARKDGVAFRLDLEPVVAPDGRVTGVSGQATAIP